MFGGVLAWMKKVMKEHKGSVVEYVSGTMYVMVWLVCRFIWAVKMCWGLNAWVGHMWYGRTCMC